MDSENNKPLPSAPVDSPPAIEPLTEPKPEPEPKPTNNRESTKDDSHLLSSHFLMWHQERTRMSVIFNPGTMNYAKPFQLRAEPTRNHEAIARYHRRDRTIRQTSNDRPCPRSPQSHSIRPSRPGTRMDWLSLVPAHDKNQSYQTRF